LFEEGIVLSTPSSPEAMTTPELVRELASNGSLLIQRQVKLAQLESQRNLHQEKTSLELLGAGGIVGYAGLIVLLVAAGLGLGELLDQRYWAGALIVGGALLLIAGIVAPAGWYRRVKTPLRRSRGELNKELSWATTQLTT
jgi:hypothetical protein